MAKSEAADKKVARLKKKLNSVTKSAEGKEGSTETIRLWHKRLKRSQRKKKSVETNILQMKAKKTKKKTGEVAKDAPKTEGSTA